MGENMAKETLVYLSAITLIGIFGNILNLIIFSRRSMRKTTTFRFLFYLSVVDLLVLIVCTTDFFLKLNYGFELRMYSTLVCRLFSFATYYLAHASSILLMAISIERVSIICNRSFGNNTKKKITNQLSNQTQQSLPVEDSPLLKKSFLKTKYESLKEYSKPKRIQIITAIILLFCLLVNMHFLFFLKLNTIKANNEMEHQTHAQTPSEINFAKHDNKSLIKISKHHSHLTSNSTDLFEYYELNMDEKTVEPFKKLIINKTRVEEQMLKICFPVDETSFYYVFMDKIWIWIDISLFCLIPSIIMMVCTCIILLEVKHKTQSTFSMSTQSKQRQQNVVPQRRRRRNNQVFILLAASNIIFIICTLPYSILYFTNVFIGYIYEDRYLYLVHIIAYLNNSTSFIFYGLFSSKYREEFCLLFLKKK